MLGPIPNSLGGGRYNGTFLPHGLVTFGTRSFQVIIRQELCIDGVSVTKITLDAVMTAQAILDAGFVDQVPLTAEAVTIAKADGIVITIKALDGLIEEC